MEESDQLTSSVFRPKATGLLKPGAEGRLTGLQKPSVSLVTAFSACVRLCRAMGQSNSDLRGLNDAPDHLVVVAVAPADVGLRPKRGPSLPMIRKLAERDAILHEVIVMPRWGNRSPLQAARGGREEFEDYEINGGWAVDCNRADGHPAPQGCGVFTVRRGPDHSFTLDSIMQTTIITTDQIRAARDKVAELALVNPMLAPIFDRLDREHEAAKAGKAPMSRVEAIAARRRRTRELI